MKTAENPETVRRKPWDEAAGGRLQRGLSLDPGDDLWGWLDIGATATPWEIDDATRYEGVEGLSETMIRRRRDEGATLL